PGVFPTTTLVSNQGTVSGGNFTSILTGDPDSTDHFIATGTDLSVMIDSVAPIITCPVDLAVDLDVDCEYVLIDYTGLATATDNCVSPVPLTQSPIVGTVITTTTTITIIADDGNGNIDSCSFDIIPADNALPTMVCQDINAYLDGSGNVSITATDINGGTTDNCGIATLVTSETDFICGDIGANNVTLIGTDVNGNIDSCIAVVTVLDTISPAPICQDITVFLDGLGNITFTAADIDGGSSDNCTSITLTASATTFTCAETGMNDVTLIVTDDSGNIDSCVAVVTVVDTTNATVICQNIDVFLDAAGDVSIIGSDIDGGSTDNCGIATLVPSITDFTCAETGANNVTLVVTDNSGNSDSCIAIVTVLDTISPIVNCLDINAFLDITGNVSISASDVDDASTDNCGIATLTISVTDFDCTDIGINTITLVVIDDHGNSDSCEATITIQDTINPTVICDDITVFLDATGNAVITASDIDGGSTDECGIGIIAASTLAFTCAEIGANNVSLYVIDNNGNLDSCLAIVTILDSLNLAVVCQDIDLYLDALGAGSITPADIDNGSSDECGIATMLTSEIDFNCADVGTNDVTLIVTDNNGNVDSCTAIVTVIDSVAPNVICQDIAIYLDATGNISIDDADIDGGATDNCGIFSIVASETTFDCSNIGLNNITLVVTDNAGLADSCIAVVTVLDTINPDVICENINAYLDEFGNVSFTVADLDGGSSDACGIDVSMASEDSFTCADIGANNVTVIVTDINGNIDSCIAVVTVIDTIAPNVICQNLTIYLDETGNAGISATDLDDGSSDACSPLTLTASQTDFICNDAGINNITLYVADDYANIDSCIAIVTVLDTIPPTIICEGDHEEYLDEDCQFIVPDYIITTSFDDNCSELEDFIITQTPLVGEVLVGTNDEFVITLTVEDESGNISSCNFTITLIDNTPPAIECIDDQAIETDFSCVYEIGDYTNLVTAELDNCDLDNVTITQFPEPGSFVTAESDVFGESNQGQTIVTIVIEDLSGNKDSCEFIIDVTCFSEIEIPQLISPNGDGKNDLLIIDWIEQYPENELIVFNRWGNIVYKASPYENDWNGESNMITIGNEVPDGSYFYQFVASPNSEVITGYIIIKR
ncbi:MAG: gliding motility-associated-like protein, partial [Crocinitomix sp.]